MATKNDITGDALISKTSNAYRDNYDRIFGKHEEVPTLMNVEFEMQELEDLKPVAWIEVERGIPMFVKFAEHYKPKCDGLIPLYD